MVFRRAIPVLLMMLAGVVLTACSGAAPAAAPAPTTAPAAAPAATAPPAAAAAAAKPAQPQAAAQIAAPNSWADVFPAGAGKQTTLERCGTCHGFDRVVLGQKTADRWSSVKASHTDKVSGMSAADMTALFGYLTQNFGPDKPEPNITGLPVVASAE
jgi:mono/diheme cytochrome c family protein